MSKREWYQSQSNMVIKIRKKGILSENRKNNEICLPVESYVDNVAPPYPSETRVSKYTKQRLNNICKEGKLECKRKKQKL